MNENGGRNEANNRNGNDDDYNATNAFMVRNDNEKKNTNMYTVYYVVTPPIEVHNIRDYENLMSLYFLHVLKKVIAVVFSPSQCSATTVSLIFTTKMFRCYYRVCCTMLFFFLWICSARHFVFISFPHPGSLFLSLFLFSLSFSLSV